VVSRGPGEEALARKSSRVTPPTMPPRISRSGGARIILPAGVRKLKRRTNPESLASFCMRPSHTTYGRNQSGATSAESWFNPSGRERYDETIALLYRRITVNKCDRLVKSRDV